MRLREPEVSFEDFVHGRAGALLRTALLLAGQNRADAEDLLQSSNVDAVYIATPPYLQPFLTIEPA